MPRYKSIEKYDDHQIIEKEIERVKSMPSFLLIVFSEQKVQRGLYSDNEKLSNES